MKITWYEQFYVGEKAKGRKELIIRSLEEERTLSGAYVIIPASNGNNILDIYPAAELFAPWYQEKEVLIVGIAADYQEALLVVRQIVDEMYQNTGGFKLQKFLEWKERAKRT